MNDIEKAEIKRQLEAMVRKYAATKNGSWIYDIEWLKIPVELKELSGDVMGKYSFGKIILRESYEPKLIFSTYVHELRHRWQWVTSPIRYIIGKLFRPLIEIDAYKQQDLADAWLDNETTTV